MTGTNGNGNGAKIGTDKVKQGLAQMLKGGVIVSCCFFCESLNMRTDFYLCFANVVPLDTSCVRRCVKFMRCRECNSDSLHMQNTTCVFCV